VIGVRSKKSVSSAVNISAIANNMCEKYVHQNEVNISSVDVS
jgi:hypothetical protein